ncbi:MAG: DUF748 domain-containing protein, partial [Pseudobdellovibrionaceae bacterium]
KKKTKKILVGVGLLVVAALIAVRMILPQVVLKNINAYLDTHSKVYWAHMDDLDFAIWRMAYNFKGIQAKLRANEKPFVSIKEVDVSLAWRELFRGRILADVVVQEARLFTAPDLFTAMKQMGEEGAERNVNEPSLKDKLIPFRVDRVIVRGSSFEFAPNSESPEAERFHFSNIDARVSNITPRENEKILGTFKGDLQKSSKLKGVVELRKSKETMDWDFDAEARQFDLREANPLLSKMLPLTFTSGELDLFAEAKSEGGRINGYVKPFFKKVDVVASQENFKGPKHFLIELGAAAGNLVLRRAKQKTVATKIDFSKDPGSEFKIDSNGTLANAIEHGFDQEFAEGIEDEVKLR